MSIDTVHPLYDDRKAEWETMRHIKRGAKAVKEKGEAYLSKPSGFNAQTDGGLAMYAAYKVRAQFPDLLRPTLLGMVGLVHRIEAQIDLPAAMKPITERATRFGLTLEALHKKITFELLLQGRYGLLVDAPEDGADLPFIAGYSAESIINWSEKRDLFVLDESGLVRADYQWVDRKKFRALRLEDGVYRQVLESHAGENDDQRDRDLTPTVRGGGVLDEIPFVMIGGTSLDVDPEDPPLHGVAQGALAIYRLDADYRHQLFWSGQETLFCFGIPTEELPRTVGAGVVVGFPAQPGVDAKYVGPSGVGITAHRQAIVDEREAAVAAGARVLDTSQRSGVESGYALQLRHAAQSATLQTVAITGAQGLEKALRYVARFIGAPEEEVVVKPNLKFVETAMTPGDAEALVRLWQSNGISKRTLYENLQRGEIASPERTFEEEEGLIESEAPYEAPEEPGADPEDEPDDPEDVRSA